MEIVNLKLPTGNRYSIFAEYFDSDQDIEFHKTNTNKKDTRTDFRTRLN